MLRVLTNNLNFVASVFGTLDVSLKPNKRISRIWIENVLEHALIVYKLRSHFKGNCDSKCSHLVLYGIIGSFLSFVPQDLRASPMLLHTTSPSESHYFRLLPSSTVHLHSHHRGPFIPKIASGPSDLHPSKTGLKLTIYQHDFTDQCSLESVSISIDPWASLGRIGTRYWGAVLAWGGALICGLGWWGWTVWDNGGTYGIENTRPIPTINVHPTETCRFNAVTTTHACPIFKTGTHTSGRFLPGVLSSSSS